MTRLLKELMPDLKADGYDTFCVMVNGWQTQEIPIVDLPNTSVDMDTGQVIVTRSAGGEPALTVTLLSAKPKEKPELKVGPAPAIRFEERNG